MLNAIYFFHKMKHLMKSKRASKLVKEIYNKTTTTKKPRLQLSIYSSTLQVMRRYVKILIWVLVKNDGVKF